MEIKCENFGFAQIPDVDEIIREHTVSQIEDIAANQRIIGDEHLEEGDSIYTLQSTNEHHLGEKYCYIKTHTIIGEDGHTKQISIEKVILDNNLHPLKTPQTRQIFERILNSIMQEEDSAEYPHRIKVHNENERFHNRIPEVANRLARYLYELYAAFITMPDSAHIMN